MGVTIYDGNIRERDMKEGLDGMSNLHDAIFDRYSKGEYKTKLGSFLSDVSGLLDGLAPEGLDTQLSFMSKYRKPRPYEKELQTQLSHMFNGNPYGDIKQLLQLTMNNLTGSYDKGYVGASDVNKLTISEYRKHEVLTIYDKLGIGGVIMILRYFIDFWYQI